VSQTVAFLYVKYVLFTFLRLHITNLCYIQKYTITTWRQFIVQTLRSANLFGVLTDLFVSVWLQGHSFLTGHCPFNVKCIRVSISVDNLTHSIHTFLFVGQVCKWEWRTEVVPTKIHENKIPPQKVSDNKYNQIETYIHCNG